MLLFYLRYDVNQVLHYFPTRRSSDLSLFAVFGLPLLAFAIAGVAVRPLAAPLARWEGRGWAVLVGAVIALRSEEHTSELQSQSNLVCRLLPEKKKFTIIKIISNY